VVKLRWVWRVALAGEGKESRRRSRGARRRRLPAAALATVVAIGLAAAGCGYSLLGTGSFLPQYIRTVAIPTFANNTSRFEVEIRMTDAVTREMVSRGCFSVVAEQEGADAVLLGTILDFTVTPVGLGADEQANNYMVTIRAQVNFRDLVENRVLFSNNSFLFRDQFELEQSPGDFLDVTNVAIDDIAEQFARSVVSSILEGF
jgi:hypothetical protein